MHVSLHRDILLLSYPIVGKSKSTRNTTLAIEHIKALLNHPSHPAVPMQGGMLLPSEPMLNHERRGGQARYARWEHV